MAQETLEARDSFETILAKVRGHYRLGVWLLIAGLAILVACSVLGSLLGGSGGPSAGGFLIYVIGSGGFALILAGAVFFVESRAFLRRNKPTP